MTNIDVRKERTQTIARVSWIIPVIAIFVPSLVRGMAQSIRVTTDLVTFLLCILAAISAVYAMLQIRSLGKQKILLPALIGLVMNGLLIAIWVSNCIVAASR